MNFEDKWKFYRDHANKAVKERLPRPEYSTDRLTEAMEYVTMNGGKRLRAILVYFTGEMLGAQRKYLNAPAAAVEFIHAYSLVHDDLPAMDDDDMRRGQPACHIYYDEATAILTGDALQARAFEIIAIDEALAEIPDAQRSMIASLAYHIGPSGMVGGQILDLFHKSDIVLTNKLKTAALFKASMRLGALASRTADENLLTVLDQYAENLGLSFQFIDDMLDDDEPNDDLRKLALKHCDNAKSLLGKLHYNTVNLVEIADFVVNRRY